MITWTPGPQPEADDGPDGYIVLRHFMGKTPAGDTVFLGHLVPLDTNKIEYATLGVLGRMPTAGEAKQAGERLGWESAQWRESKMGIGLVADRPPYPDDDAAPPVQ